MTFPLSSAAGKPTDVSGTWEPITGGAGITPDEHTAGPNHFHGFYNRGQYKTGPISGTFIQYSNYTIHTDTKPFAEVAPFDFMWRLDRTITATVEGKTGIIHMQLICRGTAYATGQAANMNRELTGTWNIISATDQLEGLHGQGTWYQHKGAITLFYEGKLFFS